MAECRSCKAKIIFAKTSNGNFIPLDAEPSQNGTMAVVGGLASYVPKDRIEEVTASGVKLYESHFATCPNSKQHRKQKGKKVPPVDGADASKNEPPF